MKKILALSLVITMLLLMVSCDYLPFFQNSTGGTKKSGELSRGTISGRVYKSEYLGLSFKKPITWKYATDEEIAEALNLGVDMLFKDDFKEALENVPAIYDMMAVDNITGSNVSVGFENLARSLASNITVEQYIDVLEKQFANMTNMRVTFPDEYDTVTLGQTEFTRVICKVKAVGSSMDQIYYLNKEGKYMRYIIVTLKSGYTVEEIEAMFS